MVLGKESRPLLSSISSRCPGASPRPAPLHQQRRADGTPGVLSRTGAEVRLYRAQRHTLMIASASSSRQNSVDVGEQRDMSDDESQGESWLVRDQIAQLRRDVEGARQIIEGQEEAIKMLREEIAMLRNGVLDSQELAPGPEPLGAPPSSIQQVPPERREESPAAPSRDVEPESPSLSPPQGPQHTRRTIFWAAGQHGPPRPSERQSNRSSSQIWTPETESRPTPTWRDTSFGMSSASSGPASSSGGSLLERQARLAYYDRRMQGSFDARFHSASWGATPKDFRILPARIILVRHAQSEGNVDNKAYASVPDSKIPITELGKEQARLAGIEIREELNRQYGGDDYKVFFYTSPYKRSFQTYKWMSEAFDESQIAGWQEEVQLREQDFGNFQDPEGKQREKAERLRFGRFFYRFPNGESGADVYDRITSFQNTMIRDVNAGRFASNCSLVLVTHGLALRVFLMSWFHWTVDQFLRVYNPANATPVILDRNYYGWDLTPQGTSWIHTKALYTVSRSARERVRGITDDMCYCNYLHRQGARRF